MAAWAAVPRRVIDTARPMHVAPIARSGIRGMLVKIRIERKPPATARAWGRENSCCTNCLRQVAIAAAAGDEQAGRQGDQEGRDLADQAVADRERGKERGGLAKAHARLDHADEQAADDVDQGDDNAGDGVAADELAGTVHGPEEIGLLADFLAAALGLALVDDPRVHVGIDGHLPARHAVQGEAGGHFADPRGALGDHDELDDDDNGKDDQADDDLVGARRSAGDELAERLHHAAGGEQAVGRGPGENQSRRGHVEHEAEERGGQQ